MAMPFYKIHWINLSKAWETKFNKSSIFNEAFPFKNQLDVDQGQVASWSM
jgi:hypothetical protein